MVDRSTSQWKIAGAVPDLPVRVLKCPWGSEPHIAPGSSRLVPSVCMCVWAGTVKCFGPSMQVRKYCRSHLPESSPKEKNHLGSPELLGSEQ